MQKKSVNESLRWRVVPFHTPRWLEPAVPIVREEREGTQHKNPFPVLVKAYVYHDKMWPNSECNDAETNFTLKRRAYSNKLESD